MKKHNYSLSYWLFERNFLYFFLRKGTIRSSPAKHSCLSVETPKLLTVGCGWLPNSQVSTSQFQKLSLPTPMRFWKSSTERCFLSNETTYLSNNYQSRDALVWQSIIIFGELIYTCKIRFLAGSNLQVRIKPDIISRFSQPEHFSRFKPANLLLNRARFAGDNLCYNITFLAGLNIQVQTWINMQVSPDNPI